MDVHPAFDAIKPLLTKYPATAASLYQAYNDLLHAQQWTDLQVVDVPKAGRGIVRGVKPKEDSPKLVVPCDLNESLSLGWLSEVFDTISPPPEEVYLGIVSSDSSIVYYRISRGIVTPPM
ncbi:hypothetical protein CALVIDRAFT_597885 [Calocera viscosa TUFC12733]|uniref:tRNA-splicing endonuclease subunit Sen15 domain-containing protein n=1 Tax=Calocera viscosa (strain TUFC12733) TaxID=1330018 RepID=A0A167MYP1_CALVF|nr:hypothetical protein CALVIDRAFT_597885 [Calocera viscosa TUFC12733]